MPDSTLQEIKDRLNIADVIGGYIPVKKAGVNFKAVCPFHNEKSASLVISPGKQIWHCFGCGEGGDIFGFVMKYENLEFKDALKILADKAGVKLPEYKPREQHVVAEEELLYKINNFAARFYHELLLKDKRGKEALEYLKKRGLKDETIKQWQIGFAPEEFHALEEALKTKRVGLQDLVKAGVAAKNDRGQIYDRFRGRITFPIFNSTGEVVGFSARILKDDGKSAKYVNSPETPIYSKSKILFGFNFAKNEIRKKDECIIVEGQMDSISPHQAGFKNVVASSGTALTIDQLQLLGRLTKNLKFCFDSDAAGLLATKRAVTNYLGKDFVIKIIVLPEGAKDPDELIRKDPESFKKAVAGAPLFLDYYIDMAFANFSGNSVEEKKKIAKELLPLLKFLTDPLEQDHYVQLLAEKFGTSPKVLREALAQLTVPKPAAILNKTSKQASVKSADSQPSIAEKEIMGGIVLYPDFARHVLKTAKPQDFPSAGARALLEPFFSGEQEHGYKDSALAKEGVFMVESQLAETGSVEAVLKYLHRSVAILHLSNIKQQLQHLNVVIRRVEKEKDKTKLHELNKQFAELSQLRAHFESLL